MRRGLSVIFVLLGASLLAITFYNVQVGMVKDIYSENAPRYKLDISAFALDESCSDKTVSAGFAKGDPADCARSVGIWETPDFIGIGVGIGFLLLSRKFKSGVKTKVKRGSSERKLKRKRRNARIRFGFGLGLLSFGFADLNKLTGPNGTSLDWSAIIGYPVPAISMDFSLIVYGSFFMYKSMRFLSRTSDAADMFSQARGKNKGNDTSFFESGNRSKFKGGLESLGRTDATVSDLYNQLGLSDYEDDFEKNLYDNYGAGEMVTGRTCHLCNGQGCARCNQTGMLD